LNPRPPAPQASVMIRKHGKNPMILDLPVVLDYGPAYEDYNKRIIKTLQEMTADGRKRSTIKSAVWTLRSLNPKVDLMNPEAVKLCVSNLKDKHGEPASDATKHKFLRVIAFSQYSKWNYLL